jgi:Zn-dependent protease with chaperone function
VKYTPKELIGNVNVSRTSPLREFFLLLTGLLGITFFIYIALGFAIDYVVPNVPAEVERSLGRLYSNMYEDTEKTAPVIQLQLLLDELADKVPVRSFEASRTDLTEQRRELKYKVHIVPRSQINALALPGGHIVIFSGLLKEVESENELAFILAHELGHFANRDHLRGLGRGLVLLTISTTLLGGNNVVTEFFMNSLLNVEMKFSQQQEKTADLWALDLLNRRYGHVSGVTEK